MIRKIISEVSALQTELSTEKNILKTLTDKVRDEGKELIISYHNFKGTLGETEIEKILLRELEIGDIGKVAFKIREMEDILKIYKAMAKITGKGKKVVAIPMGNKLARISSALFDSFLVYSGNTAPGQLTAKETRKILFLVFNRR